MNVIELLIVCVYFHRVWSLAEYSLTVGFRRLTVLDESIITELRTMYKYCISFEAHLKCWVPLGKRIIIILLMF